MPVFAGGACAGVLDGQRVGFSREGGEGGRCPVLPFRVAVITCWRLRAKCRRRMSFQAGPRRCCRPRRWRRSAGSTRAGPIPPELRCPRACRPPAARPADVAHRWCDARTDHDYRVPKRAIKIRNQASYTQAQAQARRGCPRSGPSGFAGPPRCHDRADRRATHRACDGAGQAKPSARAGLGLGVI
jgi:hypothetical protein